MEAHTTQRAAYANPAYDAVRERLEVPWTARLADRALGAPGPRRVLELGCGSGAGAALAQRRALDYTGVDFRAPGFALPGALVEHDVAEGLGSVGSEPFDLYLAAFGLASHLRPEQLARLLGDIRRHGRRGSVVVVESLGLFSLEWPRVWATPVGAARELSYELAHPVPVHPWAPEELGELIERAGLEMVSAHDRTVQGGPKLGDYWPGLPRLREALADLLDGGEAPGALRQPLPPLPAGAAAAMHQQLAARRHELAARHGGLDLLRRITALEARSGGGFGHGLALVARVP